MARKNHVQNLPLARRLFLKRTVSAAIVALPASRRLFTNERARSLVSGVSHEVFIKAPAKGTAVMAYAYYTRASGIDLMSIEQRWTRSDTIDVAYYRYSKDNGRSWTDPVEKVTGEKRSGGMLRRHPRGGFVDRETGRFVEIWNEGILPGDDPLEGMRQWNIYYSVSTDGGRSNGGPQQVIHAGEEFDAQHPLPGVFTGRNAVMIGDAACRSISSTEGSILLPVQISPLGPDGRLFNPGGGYTYTDAAVLHGIWKGSQLEWKLSEVVKGDPERSTRGMCEPVIETLADKRLIMVMRGSNDKKYHLPGYRWVSYSSDGGWKWTKPVPWTDTEGQPFYSPSACSQLLRHSSGKLFWLGNICRTNPRGNRPRYPLNIGEVDPSSGLLIRNSVRVIDDRQPGDDELLTLSNFYAREDRETGQVLLHMTRLFAFSDGWVGDAFLYRIKV